jgi:uncharacterized repeat protein (TIGR03803 family)
VPLVTATAAASILLLLGKPVAAQSYELNLLATFSPPIGAYPNGGLIADGNGNFYGTTQNGGATLSGGPPWNGAGTIFKWSALAGIQTLASFSGANGENPNGGLVTDGKGNFYGTTYNGGANGDGTIFEWSASAGVTTLVSFNGTNGEGPTCLVMGGDGNLYGLATLGGNLNLNGGHGYGDIFKWSASGGLQVLASFNGVNGDEPSGLVTDGNGNFYGSAGYTSGYGSIFKWSATGGIETLVSFNGANGAPVTSLIADGKGDLYGTTSGGGANGDGTIFKWSAAGGIQVLTNFNGANGSGPNSLIADGNGNFYGTMAAGGNPNADAGTIFKWSASGGLQTLAVFNGSNGDDPTGLIIDGEGNFYGTASGSGANGSYGPGTVFEVRRVAGTGPPSGVRAWGLNDGGQLGVGKADQSAHAMPVRVKNSPAGDALTNAIQIACGAHHTVVLKNDGTVWAFGANGSGQLGNNSTTPSNVPVQVITSNGAPLAGVAQIAAGLAFSMALTTDGQVYVWGDNTYAQSGTTSSASSFPTAQPVAGIPSTATITHIACGAATAYALYAATESASGAPTINIMGVCSWGYNARGECGIGTSGANVTTPTGVSFPTPPTVYAIAAGAHHCLAADLSGNVYAWGYNVHGEVGNGSEGAVVASPVVVLANTGPNTLLAAGNAFSLAVLRSTSGGVTTSTVYSWGNNQYGQLGKGTIGGADVLTPGAMLDAAGTGPFTGVAAIAGGTSHSLMLDNEGNVWACGDEASGEVGTGEFGTPASTSIALPIQVKNLSGVAAIAASNTGNYGTDGDSMALTNDFKFAWRSSSTGVIPYWEFSNTTDNLLNTLQGFISQRNLEPGYRVVTAVDLFGDGNRDLLLQSPTTGALAYVRLNGTNVVGSGTIPAAPTYSPQWLVVGTMNINGSLALVWQNTSTGQVVYWTMGLSGGVPVCTGSGTVYSPGSTTWQVACAYSCGSSNYIVWHDINPSDTNYGTVIYWNLSGMSLPVTNGNSVPSSWIGYSATTPFRVPTGWTLHVEDVNGDGYPDYIWHDNNGSSDAQSGQTYIWLMSGSNPTFLSQVQVSGTIPSQISIPIDYYIGGIL